jgi:hypothetical protein
MNFNRLMTPVLCPQFLLVQEKLALFFGVPLLFRMAPTFEFSSFLLKLERLLCLGSNPLPLCLPMNRTLHPLGTDSFDKSLLYILTFAKAQAAVLAANDFIYLKFLRLRTENDTANFIVSAAAALPHTNPKRILKVNRHL